MIEYTSCPFCNTDKHILSNYTSFGYEDGFIVNCNNCIFKSHYRKYSFHMNNDYKIVTGFLYFYYNHEDYRIIVSDGSINEFEGFIIQSLNDIKLFLYKDKKFDMPIFSINTTNYLFDYAKRVLNLNTFI